MRALNDHELASVSGGCFGLFSNLLGGLFGGGQAAAPAAGASTQAASASMVPAANYTPAQQAYAQQAYAQQAYAQQASAMAPQQSAGMQLEQGINNFLQNPIGGVVSLIGSGIQDAVNFFTRLI